MTFEVLVHIDDDELGTYLVHAKDMVEAGEIALNHVGAVISVRINAVQSPEELDEFDYDGVLGVAS